MRNKGKINADITINYFFSKIDGRIKLPKKKKKKEKF